MWLWIAIGVVIYLIYSDRRYLAGRIVDIENAWKEKESDFEELLEKYKREIKALTVGK